MDEIGPLKDTRILILPISAFIAIHYMDDMTPSQFGMSLLYFCLKVIAYILNFLCTVDTHIQDKIETLKMTYGDVKNNHLETILPNILPRFSNTSPLLDLEGTIIQNVQFIVDIIKIDRACLISKSIYRLNPCQNQIENI